MASFGDSSKVEIGEPVAAIGNPLGLDLSRTVTEGIVSGKRTMPVSTSAGIGKSTSSKRTPRSTRATAAARSSTARGK
ncbi:Serine protease Do-like HtrA [Geobacillus sp. BCO2]|nr:Serine protease Do-like HtrA [Geobacillus sp. BCO2]